jgi:Skp family chaperone for outer membrane proteins
VKRSTLLMAMAALALVVAVGIVIVQFVGPSNRGVRQADFDALQSQVAVLKAGTAGLKVAFINVDSAFSVFMNAVAELRQAVTNKTQEITTLNTSYQDGSVLKDVYQRKLSQLNAELLDARVSADVGTLDRMIASAAFADMRSSLQKERDSSQTLIDSVRTLVEMATGGTGETVDFQNRFTQAQSAFALLDQFVAQAATTKVQQAAKKIALAQGIDLVVPMKNVVFYYNATAVKDITELVRTEIASYL